MPTVNGNGGKLPTDRQFFRWWDAQPTGEYTCADCGRVDAKHYVQPQHPFHTGGVEGIARCGACVGALNLASRSARKAQLAQRPKDCARCGVRPHTYTYAQYRLCGRCLTLTKREHSLAMAQAGNLAIFAQGLLVSTATWAGSKSHATIHQ